MFKLAMLGVMAMSGIVAADDDLKLDYLQIGTTAKNTQSIRIMNPLGARIRRCQITLPGKLVSSEFSVSDTGATYYERGFEASTSADEVTAPQLACDTSKHAHRHSTLSAVQLNVRTMAEELKGLGKSHVAGGLRYRDKDIYWFRNTTDHDLKGCLVILPTKQAVKFEAFKHDAGYAFVTPANLITLDPSVPAVTEEQFVCAGQVLQFKQIGADEYERQKADVENGRPKDKPGELCISDASCESGKCVFETADRRDWGRCM